MRADGAPPARRFLGALPGYAAIAVPRLSGLVRLGAVPGARLLVDPGAVLTRRIRPSAPAPEAADG
ncbi:MAG: hypothetical protein ACRD03_10450 [Acidimicrobiales bacterium]